MEQLKVLVCGDRNWTDKEAIRRQLSRLPAGTLIIHGCCRGADSLANEVAIELGLPVEGHPALWEAYGKAAGPLRNMEMLGRDPDMVLAFHKNIEESKGTRDMVNRAHNAGINYAVVKE